MRPPYYDVTATCELCGTFTVQRKKIIKINTCDQEYIIQHVHCPWCNMWADISRMTKVVE